MLYEATPFDLNAIQQIKAFYNIPGVQANKGLAVSWAIPPEHLWNWATRNAPAYPYFSSEFKNKIDNQNEVMTTEYVAMSLRTYKPMNGYKESGIAKRTNANLWMRCVRLWYCSD